MNRARWLDYSNSSSMMIVVIAMLVGIYDVASLLLLFFAREVGQGPSKLCADGCFQRRLGTP
jgi:Heliorhodopsin